MFSLFKTVEKQAVKTMVNTLEELVEKAERAQEPELVPPSLKSYTHQPLAPTEIDCKSATYLEEYKELAATLGVTAPDLNIEKMKATLHKLDIPVYNLLEVKRYMDERAAKESDKAGWCWKPLRSCDQIDGTEWGTRPEHNRNMMGDSIIKAASDWYRGLHTDVVHHEGRKMTHTYPNIQPYKRTIPLHALRRMAAIEKEFNDKGNAKFFVSDYQPIPAVRNPDPFLMVVVPNPLVHHGDGRFVIDFWDEPGFGIESMVK